MHVSHGGCLGKSYGETQEEGEVDPPVIFISIPLPIPFWEKKQDETGIIAAS